MGSKAFADMGEENSLSTWLFVDSEYFLSKRSALRERGDTGKDFLFGTHGIPTLGFKTKRILALEKESEKSERRCGLKPKKENEKEE